MDNCGCTNIPGWNDPGEWNVPIPMEWLGLKSLQPKLFHDLFN